MKWCDPWATALCLYKHPSARHFHLYFWFIVPQAQSSGLLVAGIYGFFTWKANLCGSWVLPAFGSLIFEGRKDGFSGTWILLIEEIGEIRVGVFFRWSLDYRIEIFRFDVGWTGENDKKDMSTDIYKNIKDQRKKLQIQVSVPCLKPKLKKEKGKTKEEGKKKKKANTKNTIKPQAMSGITSMEYLSSHQWASTGFFGSNRRLAGQSQLTVCENWFCHSNLPPSTSWMLWHPQLPSAVALGEALQLALLLVK